MAGPRGASVSKSADTPSINTLNKSTSVSTPSDGSQYKPSQAGVTSTTTDQRTEARRRREAARARSRRRRQARRRASRATRLRVAKRGEARRASEAGASRARLQEPPKGGQSAEQQTAASKTLSVALKRAARQHRARQARVRAQANGKRYSPLIVGLCHGSHEHAHSHALDYGHARIRF